MSIFDRFRKAGDVGLERVELFRRVFDNPEGKEVLGILISELGHFDTEIDPEDHMAIAEQNLAKRILRYLDIWVADNVEFLVDSMMSLPTRAEPPDPEVDHFRRIMDGSQSAG